MTKITVELLEPKVRQEYIDKLNMIKKQPGIRFKSIDELRNRIQSLRPSRQYL